MIAQHMAHPELELEQQQIKAAQQNLAHFEPLYDRYYLRIFHFVYRRVNSKETAGELTSVVFAKALQNIQKYRFQGLPFSSWLFRIAQNAVYDHYQRTNSQRTINVTTGHLEALLNEADETTADDRIDGVLRAISSLTQEETTLVELRFFEGMSFREIGEVLDITEQNARVRLHRVVGRIKQIVNPSSKKS